MSAKLVLIIFKTQDSFFKILFLLKFEKKKKINQKAGVVYVITYTRRNVSLLALSATIFLFVVFHFICYIPNIKISSKQYAPKYVYSKTIPIDSKANNNKVENTVPISKEILFQANLQSKNNLEINPISSIKTIYMAFTTKEIQEQIQEENQIHQENSQIQENEEEQNNQENKIAKKQETQREIVKENKKNKWRIQIPKINLDVHINEGTTSNVMLKSVGHFEETSKWKGNVGLAAHNRGYQCNFFQKIKNLKIGDEIIYTTTNGKKVYRVQTNKVILETNWEYLQETKDNRITLITCEENRREYRRCVQAIEVVNYQL